jgi:hypothetical protein
VGVGVDGGAQPSALLSPEADTNAPNVRAPMLQLAGGVMGWRNRGGGVFLLVCCFCSRGSMEAHTRAANTVCDHPPPHHPHTHQHTHTHTARE